MKLTLDNVKTYSVYKRKSKVDVKDFASCLPKGSSFNRFYNSLPNILAVKALRNVSDAILSANRKKKAVIFMLGAHVIKCGLSPLVIDLMKRGVLTAVALNGAGIIHDTEIAMIGRTSEDVGSSIKNGSFGMARETNLFINNATNKGVARGFGIGSSIGKEILKEKLPNRKMSILAQAIKYSVATSVHVALGTDIAHMHPSCNGAMVGEGSLIDFRNFIYSVIKLNEGGVLINFGSAVILPEVFLKALSVARNLGHKVRNFTTANFDMTTNYRPHQNVVGRPTSEGGKGYNIIGHHEIMIPLLYQAVIEGI